MGKTRRTERGPTAPSHQPLSRILGQVERQIARAVEGAVGGDGLTVDQWRVLDILADGEGHPMSEIAGTIVVPGPTLTKIVDKLVDAALVYRLVDDRDRRRVLAFLSDKGRSLHAVLAPKVADTETSAISVLGDEGDVLIGMLLRLARA